MRNVLTLTPPSGFFGRGPPVKPMWSGLHSKWLNMNIVILNLKRKYIFLINYIGHNKYISVLGSYCIYCAYIVLSVLALYWFVCQERISRPNFWPALLSFNAFLNASWTKWVLHAASKPLTYFCTPTEEMWRRTVCTPSLIKPYRMWFFWQEKLKNGLLLPGRCLPFGLLNFISQSIFLINCV